jgi:hypothetical protein
MSELTGEAASSRIADPLLTPARGDPALVGRNATLRPGVSAAPAAAETTPADPFERLPERTSVLASSRSKAEEVDPFEGLSLTDNSLPAASARTSSPTTPVDPTPPRVAYASARKPAAVPQTSARRELVASMLTGLVGAALALAIMLIATLEGGMPLPWLSLGGVSDVVATHVRSGLYDTAGGKPVFFVHGKVENRGKTVRGPIRVVAELVGRAGADARAEAIAGAEPSPEDVHALRSAGDADKLARALAGSEGDHRIQPGASLPFFAIIADPPANLSRQKLVVRLEPLESPSAPRSAEGRR